MLMATSVVGLCITVPFYFMFSNFPKWTFIVSIIKNILYPCRDRVILSFRWFRKYLGRNVSWRWFGIPPISMPFRWISLWMFLLYSKNIKWQPCACTHDPQLFTQQVTITIVTWNVSQAVFQASSDLSQGRAVLWKEHTPCSFETS